MQVARARLCKAQPEDEKQRGKGLKNKEGGSLHKDMR